MYDKSIKIKNAKVAREMQEELAFDMKVLQKLLEETHNEALEEAQRKVRVVTSVSCDTIGAICNELCFCVFATLVTNTFILVNKVCMLLNVTGMLYTITIATKLYLSQAKQRACYEHTET